MEILPVLNTGLPRKGGFLPPARELFDSYSEKT